MAARSSILARRIPWTEEPGGLQSVGAQRVGHDWAPNTHTWYKLQQQAEPMGCGVWCHRREGTALQAHHLWRASPFWGWTHGGPLDIGQGHCVRPAEASWTLPSTACCVRCGSPRCPPLTQLPWPRKTRAPSPAAGSVASDSAWPHGP